MFWKAEYGDYNITDDVASGKNQILKKVLNTLERSPYTTADLYKYRDEERIFVETYEYDIQAWNNEGTRKLKLIKQ